MTFEFKANKDRVRQMHRNTCSREVCGRLPTCKDFSKALGAVQLFRPSSGHGSDSVLVAAELCKEVGQTSQVIRAADQLNRPRSKTQHPRPATGLMGIRCLCYQF